MSFVFDTGVLFSSVVDTVGRVKENVVVLTSEHHSMRILILKLLNPQGPSFLHILAAVMNMFRLDSCTVITARGIKCKF